MKFSDLFEETYQALLSNKSRSALTILGIVIGIGSVITMIAIGQGTQGSIESSIQSLGSDLIMVQPGMSRSVGGYGVRTARGSSSTLTLEDAAAIVAEISTVKAISPEVSGRYQITAKGTNTNTSVVGVTPAYTDVRNLAVEEGNFISEQNNNSKSRVAVLGPTVRDDLFGEGATNIIGQTIRIKSMNFTVIGITQTKGGTGMSNQDDMIYIPLATAQQFLSGNDKLTSINAQAQNQELMDFTQTQITELLLMRHNITDSSAADFSVLNQDDIIESASSIADTLTLLLGSIAGISLVVGGIGIMNMMLTAVTERTREIGLRKSIGAKSRDINNQFLAEAIMLTLIGGIVGILLGWAASWAVTHFGGTTTKISTVSVFLSFGVSALIGIVFGYYPARRAAKLNPIEALRYE